VLGLVVAASAVAGVRLVRGPRRVLSPEGRAAQAAVHAVSATLPHLRRGLGRGSAARAAPHLRALVGAPAIAVCDPDRVLAFDGAGADHHGPGDPLALFLHGRRPDRLHVEPRVACEVPGCPLGSAVVAPILVGETPVGHLVAAWERGGRVSPEDTRVVGEAAGLVGAQVALADLEEQGERLAEAELRALRAQISPHFVYNALAAIAAHIHSDPEEARELLTEFAEFTRYAFRSQRPYVTLADELTYVEKYLRLEQARFGRGLGCASRWRRRSCRRWSRPVAPAARGERGAPRGRGPRGVGHLEIVGRDLGVDAELRVRDDGPGMAEPDRALERAAGRGIGLSNVQGRLQQAFGPGYGLVVQSELGEGTTVVMTVPKFAPGVRAA
jgi:two-component system LytT family sensor kinase